MRPISEWADVMYHEHGEVAHVVPWGQPYALCGGTPVLSRYWYGTGSMSEIERARALPVCGNCEEKLNV